MNWSWNADAPLLDRKFFTVSAIVDAPPVGTPCDPASPVPPHIDSLKPSSLHSPVGQPGAKVPSGLRSTCLPLHTEPSAPLQPESHEVSFLRVGTVALELPPPEPHSTPLSGDNKPFTA